MKFVTKNLFFSLLILVFIGGCHHQIKLSELNISNEPNLKIGGLNMKYEVGTKFEPVPKPSFYYGQIIAKTTLHKESIDDSKDSGLRNYVTKYFGNKKMQLTVSLEPTLTDVKLSKVVLFSYKYNSNNKSWKGEFTPEYISPFVKLDSSTKISYDLLQTASDEVTVNLVKKLTKIIDKYNVITGAWTISSVTKPIIDKVTEIIDAKISQDMSDGKIDNKLKLKVEPAFNGTKTHLVNIYANDGSLIADINISIRLVNSLLNQEILNVSSDYKGAFPNLDNYIDPLTTIKVSKTMSIGEALKNNIDKLIKIQNTDVFGYECDEIKTKLLSTYAFTRFDTLNIMKKILDKTKYSQSESFFNNENCLTKEDKSILKLMRVPIVLENTKLVYSDKLYNTIGQLMQKPNDISNVDYIKKYFAEDVTLIIDSNASRFISDFKVLYLKDEIIDIFKKIKVARFGPFKRPRVDGIELKNGQEMFIRLANSTGIYKLAFYTGSNSGLIARMNMSILNSKDLSGNEKDDLLRSFHDKDKPYY